LGCFDSVGLDIVCYLTNLIEKIRTYTFALVDFISKLEANRALLPTIAALSSGSRYPKQKQEGIQP
jgi:hypothetical protein